MGSGRRPNPSVCHPHRANSGRGLCGPCSQFWRTNTNGTVTAPRSDAQEERLRITTEIVAGHEHRKTERDAVTEQNKISRRGMYRGKRKKPDRESRLLRMYGIGTADYAWLLDKQDNKCAICRRDASGLPIYVDHDHASGAVRGIVCARCNSFMAAFDVDQELFERLLDYKRTSGVISNIIKEMFLVARNEREGHGARRLWWMKRRVLGIQGRAGSERKKAA